MFCKLHYHLFTISPKKVKIVSTVKENIFILSLCDEALACRLRNRFCEEHVLDYLRFRYERRPSCKQVFVIRTIRSSFDC